MIPRSINELLTIAENSFKNGDLESSRLPLIEVIAKEPLNSKANELLAYLLFNTGNTEQACKHLKIAASQPTASAGALYEMASLYLQKKQYELAIKLLQESLSKNGPFFEGFHDLGLALAGTNELDKSVLAFHKALNLNPLSPEAHYNLAKIYGDLKDFSNALDSCQRALDINPGFIEALVNQGAALHQLKRYPEAIASYESAIKIDENFIDAWVNMGFCLHSQKRFDEALNILNRALSFNPNSAEAHWNKALSLLIQGDFINGFAEFEWRWRCKAFDHKKRIFSRPQWMGQENLRGKTIFLYNEQGLGDSIQFCRYTKSIADLGTNIILEADPSLYGLFGNLPGVTHLIKKGDRLPEFDFHSSLMSAPFALKTNLTNIPASSSYLVADPIKVELWKLKLGEKKRKRIGISWSSVSTFENDKDRSMALSSFIQAFPPDEYELVCLQKIIKQTDIETLRSRPDILFFGDDLKDFSDTAALIECVDLVISTCTSIPHLSGALGKPTWIVLSFVADWRWLSDRNDSPWYSSVHLYRQSTEGNWNEVMQRLAADLIIKIA